MIWAVLVMVASAVALSACAPSPAFTQENAHEAVSVVWASYGSPSAPHLSGLPEITWQAVDAPTAGCVVITPPNGACAQGVYLSPPQDHVYVLWRDPDNCTFPSYSCSSLAHELYHAALVREGYPDGDPKHTDPGWQIGGKVDQANKLLRDRGL